MTCKFFLCVLDAQHNAVARVVVKLVEFKGAWVARRVEDPSGDVLFVRKSSLRDKAQFSALQVGSRVSLTIKRVGMSRSQQLRWNRTADFRATAARDCLHPNVEGYGVLLDAVARRLQPQLARRPPERCGTT